MSGPGDLPGAVEVLADPAAVAAATAEWLVGISAHAVADHGSLQVALAGGSTPRALYDLLATPPLSERIDWETWEVWYGDERACPPDDPASNHHVALTHLLGRVPVDPGRIHRIEAEGPDLAAAAAAYARHLAERLPAGPGGAPRLDCVLLGLGENGHTASLFPGDAATEVVDAWAAPARADRAPFERVTLTFPVLDAAAAVAFSLSGAANGEALRGVAAGTVPAARVRPLDGELRWFLDTAAAEAMTAR